MKKTVFILLMLAITSSLFASVGYRVGVGVSGGVMETIGTSEAMKAASTVDGVLVPRTSLTGSIDLIPAEIVVTLDEDSSIAVGFGFSGLKPFSVYTNDMCYTFLGFEPNWVTRSLTLGNTVLKPYEGRGYLLSVKYLRPEALSFGVTGKGLVCHFSGLDDYFIETELKLSVDMPVWKNLEYGGFVSLRHKADSVGINFGIEGRVMFSLSKAFGGVI